MTRRADDRGKRGRPEGAGGQSDQQATAAADSGGQSSLSSQSDWPSTSGSGVPEASVTAKFKRGNRRHDGPGQLQGNVAVELEPVDAEPTYIRTIDGLVRELVRWRHRHGLSLVEAEARAGMSAGHLSHIEAPRPPNGRGLGAMSLPTLLALYGVALVVVKVDGSAKTV